MPIQSIRLTFREGSSDKVYNVQIEPDNHLYAVNAYYGRRGSSLKLAPQGSGLALDAAEALLAKTVNGKVAKGYKVDAGADVVLGIREKTDTGLRPQLLNPIDDVAPYLHDDDYFMQEKFDGERLMIRKSGASVVAANRKGQLVSIGSALACDLQSLTDEDYEIDGEIVDGVLHVFDMFSFIGIDLRARPYEERYRLLFCLQYNGKMVCAIPAYIGDEKSVQFSALKERGAEGVVFKHRLSPHVPGRPASGGQHLKHKFWKSASCIVAGANEGKRSIAIEMIDAASGRRVPVGNVTVKANQAFPPINSVCEVKYLYVVGEGGSLYQPEFLAVRSDIDPDECTTVSLAYRNGPRR